MTSGKKSIFINNTLGQLPRPLSFFIRVFKCTKSHFVRNWQKKISIPMLVDTVRCYKFPFTNSKFYFATKVIKATKFVSIHKRIDRYSGTRGPRHAEERCYYGFGPQRGPISQLVISCEKQRSGGGRESPSTQPKVLGLTTFFISILR